MSPGVGQSTAMMEPGILCVVITGTPQEKKHKLSVKL